MTDTLTLPVAGKDYTIPSPPARVGLALQASFVIAQARRQGIDAPPYAVERAARYDDMTSTLDEDSLGPAWDAMIEDDVPVAALRRAARAAYTWIVTGNESVAHAINGENEQPAEGVGDTDPKAGSTGTGGAGTTRKRGSTSGTTSRSKKSNTSKAKK